MMKRSVSAAIVLATTTFGFAAAAQQATGTAEGSAAIGTGTTGTVNADATAPAPAPAPAVAPAAAPMPAAAPVAEGVESDHDAVVGRLAIGYLGFVNMPYGAAFNPNTNAPVATAAAPIIGMRFWLSQMVGIDAGIGISTTFGTSKTETAGVATSINATAPTGLGVHFGLPLAIHSAKHYSFQIIPEMNLAYAQQAIPVEAAAGAGYPGATDLSGLHFDLGARAGAEVHFGFIGVPELSLVGSVGLRASINQTSTETTNATSSVTTKLTNSRTIIETTVGNTPWDIFTGGVSAFYYL